MKHDRIRILCVDDDHELSAMLDLYKKKEVNFEHIGVVKEPSQAMDKIAREKPDLVVLDLYIAGTDPVRVIREIVKAFPKIRVILYSKDSDPEVIKLALAAGACQHVDKKDGVKRLLEAVYAAMPTTA